jgi:hypothetical protein
MALDEVEEHQTIAASVPDAETYDLGPHRRATLMKRAFGFELLTCGGCGARSTGVNCE